MELQYYGANCIRITTKRANLIIDGWSSDPKQTTIKDGDTALFTTVNNGELKVKPKLTLDSPGEYEVGDTSVVGIPAQSYKSDSKAFDNTIFKIECEDIKLAIIGNVNPNLTDSQLELLGEVNVLIIPVGNHEVTLNGSDALNIIKNIEPYIVIPTHYADGKTVYETEQAPLEEALKALAMEPTETVPKLKIKSNSFTETDTTKLIVLES